MRQLVIVILLVCALAFSGVLVASADSGGDSLTETDTGTTSATPQLGHAYVQRWIDRYRHRAWHWQRVMQRHLTLTLEHPPADPVVRIRVWKRLSIQLRRAAMHPPHLRAWLCIHRYEASWTDEAAPYYGGLQMDLGFQRTYGGSLPARKGTADHWTPLEQMWVAERALHAGRGFWPWPNSGRLCGVL